MAPALTQTTEHSSLVEASRHSPPLQSIGSSSFEHPTLNYESLRLKKLLLSSSVKNLKSKFITNGDHFPSGLAPPACGRVEGCPVPPISSPGKNTMDEPAPPIVSDGRSNLVGRSSSESISPVEVNSNMGCHTTVAEVVGSPTPNPKSNEKETPLPEQNAPQPMANQDINTFLENNMGEILQNILSSLTDSNTYQQDSASAATRNPTPSEITDGTLQRLCQRQRQLERRKVFLLRRLQRITARGLGSAVSVQLNNLAKFGLSAIAEEKEKLSELDNSSNSAGVALPSDLRQQVDAVGSEMRSAALGHVHHDSDATESSSGGESCDESEGFSAVTYFKPIADRALYKYSRRRGWVASRWVWLQHQITRLEYEIQRQKESIIQIRAKKSNSIVLEDLPNNKLKMAVRSPAHFDLQDPALTCITTTTSSHRTTTLNGYHPQTKAEEPLEYNSGCARTLGVLKYRKRRYINSSAVLRRNSFSSGVYNNAHKLSEKGSLVLCHCTPPLTCILCSRPSAVKEKGQACVRKNFNDNSKFISNNLSLSSKLAKYDPAFHPVLSQKSEMLQRELYSSYMKAPKWHLKVPVENAKLKENTPVINEDDSDLLKKFKREKELRKNFKRLREDGKERITLTHKRSKDDIDEEFSGWQISSGGSGPCSPCPSPALADKVNEEKPGCSGSSTSSSSSSTCSTSSNGSVDKDSKYMETRSNRKHCSSHKNKHSTTNHNNSYDINNIVIPHNMASVSRVEPLQYKEITTPQWRIVELKPLQRSAKRNSLDNEEEQEEDISDEAFIIRHNRSLELERKKFLKYLHNQSTSSRARSRRTDSSGTNTPDNPLSPRTLEPSESSPMGSPPHTPLMGGPSEDSNHSTSNIGNTSSTVLTLSLSSLQSSMLKSNCQSDISFKVDEDNEILNSKQSSNNMDLVSSNSQPVNRMKRIFRSFSAVSEDDCLAEGRVSPFPSRTFPLQENELENLIEKGSCHPNVIVNKIVNDRRSCQTFQSKALKRNDVLREKHNIPIHVTEDGIESGRESPLSELTDSAPDQEDEKAEDSHWDDSSAPDWTISALQDDSGCYVLQVQRN